VPVATPGATTLKPPEFTKDTLPDPSTIDTFVTSLAGAVSAIMPAAFVTARFLAVMLPVGCVMPLTAASVTVWPAAWIAPSARASTADTVRPPLVTVEVNDWTLHFRSADWALTVSGPPRTVVLPALFAAVTAPDVADRITLPDGAVTIPPSWPSKSIPPLVAVTVTGLPAPVFTVSMMRTLGAEMSMRPLRVLAPAITSGFAVDVIGRSPGAVRLGPSTV